MRFQTQRFPGTFFFALLLAVTTLLLYFPVLNFGFISIDDTILVLKNPLIQSLDFTTLKRIFTSYDPELYVPLTMLSYHIDFLWSGLSPVAYHAQNLLLHILSTLLVFFLFLRLGLRNAGALFGATLFAVHPINTEAVAWVAARKDLLSTFFALLSIQAFLEYVHTNERRWFFGALIFFLAGLLSKATILLLPVFFFLLLSRENSLRSRLQKLTPFMTLSVLFGMIAIMGKMRTFGAAIPLTSYPLLSFKAMHQTLLHFIAPLHLSPLYPQITPVSIFLPDFYIPLFTISLLAAGTYVFGRSSKSLLIGISLFLVGFLPSFLTFTKNGEIYVTSDRYAYFASIGLFWIFASTIIFLWDEWKARESDLRHGVTALAVWSTLALFFLTIRQLPYWRSNESILRHIITTTPLHALAYNNLGAELQEQKKTNEAALAFRAAILQNPHFILPHINLASLYLAQGKRDEALQEYRQAIAAIDRTKPIQSDDLVGYYLLGTLLSDDGDDAGALTLFSEAAALAPEIAEAQMNLALTLHRLQKFPEAMLSYERAIALDASLTQAHYNLAELYAGAGKLPEALRELDAVLALEPGNEKARMHQARIRELLGK